MSAAFAVVLLTGGTAACGEGTASDPASPSGRSPEVTPAQAVAKAAAGAERITSLHYRVTGTVPQWGRLRADASMHTAPPTMGMKLSAGRYGGKQTEVRFVDGAIYIHGDALRTEMLKGASWFTAEQAAWGSDSFDNNSYGMLPRQLEANPALQSTMLTASKDVRRIRTETVDGVRTTHYKGTVTSDGIRVARDAAAGKAARERQINNLGQFWTMRLKGTLTVDLWIGDDNRTKQFRMRSDTFASKGGTADQPLEIVDGEPFDMTVTFLEANAPVTVETPPSDDTADLAELGLD
ncbi:hypothetical protein [Streptomyces tendae]|uniref:hypothetical protein n=1 Tax=Streptomyces tendae TaxID=1932 RepID=UPI0024912BF9|nr:hypothetical protein [Streptomyces tendae]